MQDTWSTGTFSAPLPRRRRRTPSFSKVRFGALNQLEGWGTGKPTFASGAGTVPPPSAFQMTIRPLGGMLIVPAPATASAVPFSSRLYFSPFQDTFESEGLKISIA